MNAQSQPLAYTSVMKFTIDGRPSMDDINQLFSSMIAQITPTTHRYMFRSYTDTFSSEDAIKQLGSLKFSKRDDSSSFCSFTTTTFNMERGMAKALIQQFLWTRLIESATEPQNRTYRDKGIWRVKSKGLCVLQGFCEETKMDYSIFKCYVTPSVIPMYLINVDRMKHNDRINYSRRYISYLFTIMIASLPLNGNGYEKQNEAYTLREFGTQHSPGIPRTSSIHSSDSSSTDASTKWQDRNLTITDLFPDIGILPNNLLVDTDNENGVYFQQHQSLIGNLSLSSSNKFKMRAVFSSLLCCNWLIEYCTVSSTDEAETLMSEFLKLGWVQFFDSKYSHLQTVESSKASILKLTKKGMKVVIDVSLNQHNIMNSTCSSRKSSLNSPYDTLQPETTFKSGTNKPDYFNTLSPEKGLNGMLTPPATPTFPVGEFKESNASKLKAVLKNAQLRSLFRNFLSSNFCQENLDFWIDYDNLRRRCNNLAMLPSANQRQLLEDAYALWDSYLRPGAICELNIEHILREEMAEEMSHIVTVVQNPLNNTPTVVVSTYSAYQSLSIILKWFDKMNEQTCKLMSSDSIPKFVKTPKYKNAIKHIQSSVSSE
ncbi:hypothetical protein G6F56_000603 [Rhizopus delemar]|uniref:RGS domain-containing protein n=1 Tax=Rhizopus stolonifer TaxID=4846 RepID=A0A367J401_RHIST|nr:hypothetical protein G6F56_000603 [Rhizopus delemar]RCH84672.1 hypothetical protein CU098_005848 [Rhizopus stolonifer]